jgi:hypothetical protein
MKNHVLVLILVLRLLLKSCYISCSVPGAVLRYLHANYSIIL